MAVSTQPETVAQIAPRSIRIVLDGRYGGWWFDADPEPTMGQLNKLGRERSDLSLIVLADLITGWNFRDKHGNAVPFTPDPASWDDLTPQLLRAVLLSYLDVVKKDVALPKA